MNKGTFFCLALILSCACASQKIYHTSLISSPSSKKTPEQSIFLVGGSLDDVSSNHDVNELISHQIEKSKRATVLYLGDNFTDLNDPESIRRAFYFENDPSNLPKLNQYLITGERDWDNGGRKGNVSVRYLEHTLEKRMSLGKIIRPNSGCPGPEEIQLNDNVVILLLNTQWWLHQWDKPTAENGCEVSNETEFISELKDAILRNSQKKIIVVGHHSLFASGEYGGHFNFESHLFPITHKNNKPVYFPLPGLGSMYVWYRQLLGNIQDLSNPVYKRMRNDLQEAFSLHDNIIYVSGHEHSLEYYKKDNHHYVNSGAFSRGAPIRNRKAEFASSNKGFGELNLYDDGTVELAFWSPEVKDQPLYRTVLFQQKALDEKQKDSLYSKLDFSDSVITTYATKAYLRSTKKPGMLGNNYREEWAAPIKDVPLFDIGKRLNGLEIFEKGGGMQTKSLKLKEDDGKEWGLRSIVKYPENAIPDELRGTFAENFVKEQISAAHPYAAFVVPPLADAAGVYHTNPELVYLPDDPRLGIYRQEFANALYLFEERPDGERKDVASFGRPEDIISTEDVIDEMKENGNNYADQEMVLRSRLFDILIGDWDRHEDQWRWAQFEHGDGFDEYRPIPRDRDNVFFCSDGWLMDIATHRWGIPKFQGFHHKIRDVSGMNYNARHFDRTFLTKPEWKDWQRISHELQDSLTDEVIENAIKQFPKEIFDLHGEEIISKLKSRRNDLPIYAREYYEFLAKGVDVLGSEKNDRFEVDRLNDEETKVTVYQIHEDTEEKEFKYYERTFNRSETNEIRLYGFDDEDVFVINGDVNKGIKVRIIGGDEEDKIIDESKVNGLSKETVVYDTKKETLLVPSSETRDKRSDKDPLINFYDRKAFKYDLVAPLLYGGFNPDDGIFLGLGGFIQTHGFRKDPFKSQHLITGTIAPRSASFNIDYSGKFTEAVGNWDANINAGIFYPSYSNFFYGLGNETKFDEEKLDKDTRYYALRYRQIVLNPELVRASDNEYHTFTMGTKYRYINVRQSLNEPDDTPEQNRFIVQYQDDYDHKFIDIPRHYLSGYLGYKLDSRDNKLYPQSGILLNLQGGYEHDIDHNDFTVDYFYAKGNASTYLTFGNTLKSTLAIRAGGAINNGEYELYQANVLGGSANLRGYRKERFAGDKIVYQNIDLRVRLFKFWTIILPGEFGLVFFHDFGKVWEEDDPSTNSGSSNLWHRGYGGGFYIAPLGKAALTFDYSKSNTGESAFFIRLGFMF